MRAAKTLAVMFLAVTSAAFGQAPIAAPTGLNGRPQVTTFLHQTLGESWEDFMRITGTKMNPCGSQEPQAGVWCDSFKKIEAGGQADIAVGKGDTSVSLIFSQKRLMQVLAHGKADFSKSLVELSQQYGTPDMQTANTAVWSFLDGGGVTAISKPGNEVVVVYYCKDAKEEVEHALAPPPPTNAQETKNGAPISVKGHMLGETIAEFILKAPGKDKYISLAQKINDCRLGFNNKGVRLKRVTVVEPTGGLSTKHEVDYSPNYDASFSNKINCEDIIGAVDSGARAVVDSPGDAEKGWVPGQATLDRGKLVAFVLYFRTETTSAEKVNHDIAEKFGLPTSQHVDTFQNGFGARFEIPRLVWVRDDAVIVSRALSTHPADTLEVIFWTRAEFEKVTEAVKDAPNSIN
jgi:hypothetical protein